MKEAASAAASLRDDVGQQLPRRLTRGLPLLVVADMALLLVSHILVGASEEVSGEAPLGTLKPHTASKDNLFTAVVRLWDSGAYCLVAIVALLSGLWPYVKLLLTALFVGRVTAGRATIEQGRFNLRVLEMFGKYSFADVLLICCNSVIFDVSTGGKYRIMGLFHLELNMWMQIHFAALALIVAVTGSVVLTHWAIHEMDARLDAGDGAAGEPSFAGGDGEPADAPGHGELERGATADSAAVELLHGASWTWQRLGAAGAALATAGLLLVGALLPVVVVERTGFLGNLIRPEEARTVHVSVFSVCTRMLQAAAARGGDAYAVIFVGFFFALTLAAPLLELLLLACAAAPSSAASSASSARRRGRGLLAAAGWCHSFACVEIFLLVGAAIVFEIQTTIEFNVGEECKPFENIMKDKTLLNLAGLGFAASDDCFAAATHFAPGALVLLLALGGRSLASRLCASAAATAASSAAAKAQ